MPCHASRDRACFFGRAQFGAHLQQYAKIMKVRDILKILGDDGWYVKVVRGSHRQLKHPTKPGRVTVAGKPSDKIRPGMLNSTLKQGGVR